MTARPHVSARPVETQNVAPLHALGQAHRAGPCTQLAYFSIIFPFASMNATNFFSETRRHFFPSAGAHEIPLGLMRIVQTTKPLGSWMT